VRAPENPVPISIADAEGRDFCSVGVFGPHNVHENRPGSFHSEAAVAYPIAAGVKAAGGAVAGIIGGRTRDLVILEDHMRQVADPCIIATDDGSYGMKGLVTDGAAGSRAMHRVPEQTVRRRLPG
jgi:hypothetical protein